MKVFKFITQNNNSFIFKMDLEDYLNHYGKSYSCINAKRGKKYLRVGSKLFHRVITNAGNNQIVDHIDRDPFNNTKNNLRLCSYSQNSMNRTKSNPKRGVCFNKLNNNWRVRIGVNKKTINIGSFKNEYDAIIAYNNAAIKYHGQFATLINL